MVLYEYISKAGTAM